MPKTLENFVGRTFSYLTPIERVREGKHRGHWICRCVCGKITKPVRSDYLKTPGIHSCGCQHPRLLHGPANASWKGCGHISMGRWSHIRNNALHRGWDFEITIEDAWKLFQKQDGKCALSGVPLAFGTSYKAGKRVPTTASLDRIDSTQGYTIGNIQWVHKAVNKLKMEMGQEEFLEWCQRITEYQINRAFPGSPAS